jgi:hypothetical protein
MPGQFKHLAPALARDPANRVVFLARRDDVDFPGVRRTSHRYFRLHETAVLPAATDRSRVSDG